MITSEPVELGRGAPHWLKQSLLNGELERVLIIHPTSEHRHQFVNQLNRESSIVHPSNHVTYSGLLRQLASDLRLPSVIELDIATLQSIHSFLEGRASELAFPLLHSGAHPWSFSKTQRILSTLKVLLRGEQPWNWSENPGFDDIVTELQSLESQMQRTFAFFLELHVLQALKKFKSKPFHLELIDGIIILNQPPDYTPMQASILQHLAEWVPVHQLIAEGSFRLGFHGRYLVDQAYDEQETLPFGLHAIERPKQNESGWQTSVGKSRESKFVRVLLSDKKDIFESVGQCVAEYLQQHEGEIIIIDPCGDQHQTLWQQHLSPSGIDLDKPGISLHYTPHVQQLLGIARIGYGVHAWSFANISRLLHSGSLTLLDDIFPELRHPTVSNWRPCLHQHVLEKCSSIHHLLGGPGALARWRTNLQRMQPIENQYEVITAKEIEETQWALAAFARLMGPLLSPEDNFIAQLEIEGAATLAQLPLPESPPHVFAWFEEFLCKIDWSRLLSSQVEHHQEIQGLEKLISNVRELEKTIPQSSLNNFGIHWFFERLTHICSHVKTTGSPSNSNKIRVLQPDQAFGLECDFLILTHLDLESWSMRQPVIPWLDEYSKQELGFFSNDQRIRQGRHQLRHLLNCSPQVVIFDTSLEEGGEPSAPLSEWFTKLGHSGMSELTTPFEWMELGTESDTSSYWGQWYDEKKKLTWITPRPLHIRQDHGRYVIQKNGIRQRNIRQNLGLELKYGLEPSQPLNSIESFLPQIERQLHQDRILRQPSKKNLAKGEVLDWDSRSLRTSISDLKFGLNLKQAEKEDTAIVAFPHLGIRGSRSITPYIDPNPLPPAHLIQPEMEPFSGIITSTLERNRWSPSRIQAWLECPRKGWAKQFLNLEDEPSDLEEDINPLKRGDMIHEILAHILERHGVVAYGDEQSAPLPLHCGAIPSVEHGWELALSYLAKHVTWLEQDYAISVHRCRSLIGASPQSWREHLEGTLLLPLGGSIGQLIQQTYSLTSSAPVAVEWPVSQDDLGYVNIITQDDVSLCVNGFADRVDLITFDEVLEDALVEIGFLNETEFTEPFPMDYSDGIRPAQRYVIIRDIKTVNGPKTNKVGERHFKGLMRELQLALYARAWEITHPNDRVVGVGISEVGEWSEHYVEIDGSAFPSNVSLAGIGRVTQILNKFYPISTLEERTMTPFRMWMKERIQTALRVLQTAAQGHVNPTPGSYCSYCPINNICTLFDLAGGEMD
ncbi:MAG: PD-(D/E)XK nuclease family protein [archaeon]|nr:PD-(D/E)XK nuclease family protein [archaeon]MDA1167370.1 PD-(D/E)XK nuclease family protein [archaeon]